MEKVARFRIFCLIFFQLFSYSLQDSKRIFITDENNLYLHYDGNTDTIPGQKTVNLYTINTVSSLQKSTFSFWFYPTAYNLYSSGTSRRRRLSVTPIMKSTNLTTYQGLQYSVTILTYSSDTVSYKSIFTDYLTNYQSSLIFNVLAKSPTGAMSDFIGVSYRNDGSYYAFVIQTDSIAAEIELGDDFSGSAWIFVSIGINYSQGAMIISFISGKKVYYVTVPLSKASSFTAPSLFLGGVSKYPTEFYKNIHCNCLLSKFIWYYETTFGFFDTFDLRRTPITPLYYTNFNESSDDIIYMSSRLWINILQSYYKNATNKPNFILGTTGNDDTTIPFYDRTLMGVTFSEGKSAYFSLNFPIMSPNGLDFSMSFWIKVDLADGTARCILQSENYGQYRFLYAYILNYDSKNVIYIFIFDQQVASFAIQIGVWYFFSLSFCNFLYSPMIHFSSTLFSFASGKSILYATDLPIPENELAKFISNMNVYCKGFYFAYNNFVGSIKTFSFYHGTYLPPDSSSPDNLCEIPYYFPETFFLDSANDGFFINPYECLVCKANYTYDSVNKKCVPSPSTCAATQQNFLSIIGKCEDCYANCKFPVCGNGIIEGLEVCDSGATGVSSGCSSDCLGVKDTWKCVKVKAAGFNEKFISSCSGDCTSFHCFECALDTNVGEWSCNICDSGYILLVKENSLKTCVNACPENYYVQTIDGKKICSSCNIANCSRCNDEKTKCLQCSTNLFLDTYNGACYESIPLTHYQYDQANKYILPCDQAMTDCNECSNSTFCTSCKNSKYLLLQNDYKRNCVSICPEEGYSPSKIFTILLCQPCKISNCASCLSNYQVCTQCKNNFYLDLTKSVCVESIPPDYFLVNKDSLQITTCSTFISNCYSCTDDNNCTECLSTTNNALYTVDDRTICQEEVPQGYYVDTSTNIKILKKCAISNCIVCSLSDPSKCNECESSFFKDIDTTICYSSPFPSTHYHVEESTALIQECSRVLENCSSCYNKTYCTSCSNQNSLLAQPSNSQKCVYKCPEGYYTALNSVNQNECRPCKVANCSQCNSDPNKCDLCKTDQYQDILSTFCYSSKPSGYFFVNQTNKTVRACNSTESGYGYDCLECEEADKCLKCATLNLLVIGSFHICVDKCPEKFASRLNPYYGKFCEACTINNCSSCPVDMNTCTKCLADNYLDIKNTTSCFFLNKIPDGYFVSDSQNKIIQFCNNTLKNCMKCLNETYCLQCESNYNLALTDISTKKCVDICPSGYYVRTNETTGIRECDKCKVNFCEKCDENPLQCEKCFAGKLLDVHNKICFDVFPSGYYFYNKTNDEIMPCNVSLSNCQLCDNANYCNLCQNDYYSLSTNSLSRTCVEKCPINSYFSNETAKMCEKCQVEFCNNCILDVEKCSQCSENKFIDIDYNNSCLQTKPSTHYNIDENLRLIKSCNLSIDNCIKCENNTHCLECAPNFGLLRLENISKVVCEEHTPSGYYKKNVSGIISYEFCKVNNCKNCDINPNSQCVICEDGNYLDVLTNSTCYKNLEEGFFIFANDSANNQKLIKPCNSSIKYCDDCINATVCTKCHHLYSLSPEGTCLSECSEGFYLDESNNYTKKCLPCPINNCSDCYSDKEKCFKCKNDKFLDSNLSICYNNLPNDYFLFDNLTNIVKKCDAFINNCMSCKYDSQVNQTTCLQCSQKYVLYLPNKTNQYACLEDCPNGFYKGILNICRKCTVENCSKCDNDSSKCEKCLANKYLDTSLNESCLNYVPSTNYISQTIHNNFTNEYTYIISLCNSSLQNCLECSNSSHCTKCEENLILNSNGKCKKNCPSNSFFDQKSDNCEKCPANCSGCFNTTSCKICANGFYSLNDSCQNCSQTQGLMSNCSEICGDGILFNRSENNCDDGNLIDGDGCDSKCQIEPGFNCSRINSYVRDICYDASPIKLELITRPDSPEKVIIHPSRKLKYNKNFASALNISIPSLDPSNYSISVDNEPDKLDITIKIIYKVNAKNAFMLFNLIPPSKIIVNNAAFNRTLQNSDQANNLTNLFSDENNITIDEKYFSDTVKITLYPNENLNQEQKEQVQELEKVQSNVATTLVISTSSLSILQTLNIFWLMVDAMQIANFFLYINVFYPSNLQTYLKILSSANLNFIPNPFPSGADEEDPEKNFKIFGDKIVDQRAPLRFESLEKTSLFLKNSGLQVVILAVTWLFYLVIIFATEYIKKNKIVTSWSAHVNKIREKLEFGWFIQIHLMVMLEFCLGCFLQIRDISGSNGTNIASAILSLVTFLYISLFLLQILRVVNSQKKVVLEDKEFKRKYDILFEEYQKFKFMQRNYPAVVLIKKYLMVFSIVILHDYPVAELTALFAIFIGNLIILVVARPFKRRLTNAIMIFTELVFIIILALVSFIFSLDRKTDDMIVVPVEIVNTKVIYGWVIIALFSFILTLYLIVFLRQQILTFIEFLVYLKESKKKYKDFLKEMFRKKMLNKPILKTQISKGSICTCEMVEDPYKDLPKEKIDPKFYNMEKMPETSFSKFITNMKSKATNNSNNENETQITINSKEKKEEKRKIKTEASEDLQSPSFSYEKKQRETLIKSEMKKN